MGLPSHQLRQKRSNSAAVYVRHRPETTLLYQVVQEYWPEFQAELASHGKNLPAYVTKEFEAYLKCGRLEYGFLRVRCESCNDEKLVAFSCKRRGFCPSCGARRMADSAALLVDEILPYQPMRQWVLSVPFPLRFLFASCPAVMGKVLGIVYRTIATHLTHKAGYTKVSSQTGAVTLIQRFGGALNLNVHFHMLFLDGVYFVDKYGSSRFRRVKAPTSDELSKLTHTIAHRVGRYFGTFGEIYSGIDTLSAGVCWNVIQATPILQIRDCNYSSASDCRGSLRSVLRAIPIRWQSRRSDTGVSDCISIMVSASSNFSRLFSCSNSFTA